MKNTILVLFAVVCHNFLHAQNKLYNIKPGENADVAMSDVKFHYKQFTQGTVFFRDGTTSNALLNYNTLVGEMQFIAPKGDTMAVTNEATIRYIVIDNDTFFYDHLFLQLVTGNSIAKLAKKENLVIIDVKKLGAYDQFSSTSSITTIKSINSSGRVTNLTEGKELTLMKKSAYYVGDAFNHFVPATKKNITRMFTKKQSAVEDYFKNNKVNLNNEEDLKALLRFIENI